MSAFIAVQHARTSAVLPKPQRPYEDCSLDDIIELLERQYDQERTFNELMVFELARRAVEAQRALRRQR